MANDSVRPTDPQVLAREISTGTPAPGGPPRAQSVLATVAIVNCENLANVALAEALADEYLARFGLHYVSESTEYVEALAEQIDAPHPGDSPCRVTLAETNRHMQALDAFLNTFSEAARERDGVRDSAEEHALGKALYFARAGYLLGVAVGLRFMGGRHVPVAPSH